VIYPTLRAVVIAALGAPVAIVIGIVSPDLWLAAPAWLTLLTGMILLDAGLAWRTGRGLSVAFNAPARMGMGVEGAGELAVAFGGAAPRRTELAIESDDRIGVSPDRLTVPTEGRSGALSLTLTPRRRGEATIERAWVRWTGPLGLVWSQHSHALRRKIVLTPDIAGVKAEAMRLFARDAMFGVKAQIDTGSGAEYHALRDYADGMDPRTVDWKQSARHGKLIAKEYRTERNHHILLALDTGRTMSEPLAGLPRIDRAINAALTLAYVSLKIGDRVGLFGFDARPRLSTGIASGVGSFPLLEHLAASLVSSEEETNYTLGLTQLASDLERRSLIVVFTELADPTSAELLIENAARIGKRHLLMFVVFRDEELETFAQAEPVTADDVSRAVAAATLLRERELVITRLRRTGAHIVDAPVGAVGPRLLNAYLDLKRRDLL
jgi:uncharacterized protein (DUF58 family)